MREKVNFSNEEIYKRISSLDLILIALHSLTLKEQKAKFENIVKESFNLFPKVFAFDNIPQWPDARKLDRPLRTLRSKKLIKGNPNDFFYLTPKGKKRVLQLIEKFYQKRLFNL